MAQTWWQKQGYSSDPTISSPLKGPNINFTPASGKGYQPVKASVASKSSANTMGSILGKSTTYTPVATPKIETPTLDTDSFFNNQKKAMEEEKAKRAKQAEKIGDSFDPVFKELSRQLAELPTKEADYKKQIEAGEEEGRSQILAGKQRATETLQKEKASNLRNLEEDVRNQQESAGTKIGLAGAGSSSSVDQASEAIMRVGQKTRGDLLQAHETKLTEIETVANNNLSELNTWKREKLFEITDAFKKQMDSLFQQKAEATSSKKRAVESLIFDLEKEYAQSLRSLDQQVLGYKQQVESWKMQEASNIQNKNQAFDSASKDVKLYQQALATFNDLIASGNLTKGQAQQEILNAFGVLLPIDDSKKDEFANNTDYRIVNDVTGSPYYVNMNDMQSKPAPVFADDETSSDDDGFLNALRGLID